MFFEVVLPDGTTGKVHVNEEPARRALQHDEVLVQYVMRIVQTSIGMMTFPAWPAPENSVQYRVHHVGDNGFDILLQSFVSFGSDALQTLRTVDPERWKDATVSIQVHVGKNIRGKNIHDIPFHKGTFRFSLSQLRPLSWIQGPHRHEVARAVATYVGHYPHAPLPRVVVRCIDEHDPSQGVTCSMERLETLTFTAVEAIRGSHPATVRPGEAGLVLDVTVRTNPTSRKRSAPTE